MIITYAIYIIDTRPSFRRKRNIIDTRHSFKIPGTDISVRPGNYYCNSSNVIYLIKVKKCNSGSYIFDTSTIFALRMNNHKASETASKDYQ